MTDNLYNIRMVENVNKLKIYLDNCCYNRPFDDFTIGKNGLEAHAKLFIQSLVRYKSFFVLFIYVFG